MSGLRRAIAALLIVQLVSGCVFSFNSSSATIRWTSSIEQCTNGRCTYGSNASPLSAEADCGSNVALDWSAAAWKNGSVAVRVTDGAGAEVYAFTARHNGYGNQSLSGSSGTWTISGQTSDANGQFQATISC